MTELKPYPHCGAQMYEKENDNELYKKNETKK